MVTYTYNLGTIADWMTAIGTVGAVITSLYLSNRNNKALAKVTSKFGYLIDASNGPPEVPSFVIAEIVNVGLMPIYLSECTIQVGKEKMIFLDGSHTINKLLNTGQFYSHNLDYNQIKAYMVNKGLKKLKTNIFFRDATGKKYKSKIKIKL